MKNKSLFFALLLVIKTMASYAQSQPPAKTWHFNDRGQKTTVKERWGEDGQGLKHGTYIKYFEDGERETLGYYSHGMQNGQWTITIYQSSIFGTNKSTAYVNFLNGKQNGLYKIIRSDKVLVQGNYTNDRKTGYWKDEYDTEQTVYSEGNYVNGERDGVWKNTCVTKKNEDEIAFGILMGNVSEAKVEVKQGFVTKYKNGEVIAVYDDKGINLVEKAKQESLQKSKMKQVEEDFENCLYQEDFENFRAKYPNSKFDVKALEKIAEWKNAHVQYTQNKLKENEDLQNRLDNCDNAFCLYLLTNTTLKEAAQTKIPLYLNNIKFDSEGKKLTEELPLSFSIIIELKVKYAFDILKYLGYAGGYLSSIQIMKDYPSIGSEYTKQPKELEETFNKRKFFYETFKGKFTKVTITSPDGSVSTLEFNKEGYLEVYRMDGKSANDKIFFDKSGKVILANCDHNLSN